MTPEANSTEENSALGGIPDLSDAISKLMAHPEIIEMAASVLGQPTSPENTPSTSDSDAPQGDEEILPKDSSIPAGTSLDGLPDLLRMAGPLLSGIGKRDGAPSGRHGKGIGRCTALLLALKPYLSESRCHRVDQIVQVSQFGELFEKLR